MLPHLPVAEMSVDWRLVLGLLALLVPMVAIRLGADLVVRPDDVFDVVAIPGG